MSLRDARALIFDLDGTLIDSLDDIALHLNAVLEERGLPSRTRAEIGEWVGYGAEELIGRAVPQEHRADALESFSEYYRQRPVVHTHVFDGLVPVLDQLASRYTLAILSNKPHDLAVQVTEQLLKRWPFAVVAGHRPDKARKPDPASILDLATVLSMEPAKCVMIGDSEVDIETGRSSGITTVACAWGLRPLQVIVDAQPDHIVHTPAEFGALFAQLA